MHAGSRRISYGELAERDHNADSRRYAAHAIFKDYKIVSHRLSPVDTPNQAKSEAVFTIHLCVAGNRV